MGDVPDAEAEHAKHDRSHSQAVSQSKKRRGREARRERTVVLVSPADHAQHVKERAVHENVTQGVMDSPQQHRREVSTLSKHGRDGRSDDPRDKKTKERTHSG